MRKLPYLIATAALSGLALSAAPASASPITSGLANGNVPAVSEDGLVQKVHRWHCRKRYGWFRGHKRWHRHWRACDDYSLRYGVPTFGFSIFIDDDDHDRKRFRKKRKHNY
jgi:hypothetical protein